MARSNAKYAMTRALQDSQTNKRLFVTAHTASKTLKYRETGSVHTNLGATGTIILTLPQSANKGLCFDFAVMAGQTLSINPGAAGAIYINGAKQTDDVDISSGAIGNAVSVTCDGNHDWIVTNQVGTWNIGAANLLWDDCPWDAIGRDPTLGYRYFNDFTGSTQTVDNDEWAITNTTSGALTNTTGAGGILLVDSAGNLTADDGIEAQQLVSPWVPAAGKTLWFEARVAFSKTTPDQYYVGLAAINTTLIATGVVDDEVDKVGWFSHAGTTANRMSFITSDAATEAITADAATIVNGTYIRLGFKLAGAASATPYVNGVAGTEHSVAASVPDGIAMAFSLVSKIENAAADAEMSVDWVKIAQLR